MGDTENVQVNVVRINGWKMLCYNCEKKMNECKVLLLIVGCNFEGIFLKYF